EYSERGVGAGPPEAAPAGRSVRVRCAVVQVVAAALAEFHLQGRVVDAEALVQALVDPVEERVMALGAGPDQVRGHRDLARAQRPDVQVVDRGHSRLVREPGANLGLVEPRSEEHTSELQSRENL